ncbi:MAG TPA: MtnX-like HAD-IB family phosphatase [Candidatus Methylomirabilis sp.]|nr:MtnX-like HAD-IB family phosphatase [Candidatus Methylomirabilis sp.]
MLFIVDFDGTIAPTDTVDALLETFADPEWRRVEEQWITGQLNSQECMKAQLALVRADRAILESFLQSVVIDPFFSGFVQHASAFADIAVVSDGLDYPIRHALQKHDIPPLPVYANKLEFRKHGLDLSFPHADQVCAHRSGVCKCAAARALDDGRGLSTVLIGDGRSDRCLARSADYVFAKGSLRKYCEEEGITHTPFDSFDDVLAVIRNWNTTPFNQRLRERTCPLEAR